MLEIIEDRHGLRSTLITSQLPVKHWHDILGDPTLADAIMDRLVHNAYKINLKGDSMRKQKNNLKS
jgi:DNA replication protein DnaC